MEYQIMTYSLTPADHATRPGRVIVVKRDSKHEPFVTAWQGGEEGNWDSSWYWGHYFQSREEAMTDYNKRVARGY